jgi:quinoprotein glucose dehydrogenase
VLAGLAVQGTAQQQRAAGDWPNITGSEAGTRCSAVDQINASNFNTLKVAWEWRGVKDAGVNLGGEVNARGLPIYVDGMLITVSGPRRTIVSLDPATGKTLWTFQEPTTGRQNTGAVELHGRASRIRVSTAAASRLHPAFSCTRSTRIGSRSPTGAAECRSRGS